MAVREKYTPVSIAFFILMMVATKTAGQLLSSRCEEGWTFFREPQGSNGMCYLPVQAAMTVRAAERFCQNRLSYLVNLDRIDQFTYFFNQQERTVVVPQFIFDNFHEFWSGMRIAKNGRLMWHAFGPKFLKRSKFDRRPWNWKQGQPVGEVNTCGHVTLGKRPIETLPPDLVEATATNGATDTNGAVLPTTPPYQYNGVIEVEMAPCDKQLPFVCEKSAIQRDVNPTSQCPEGWVGHPYLTYCLRLVNEKATYNGAKKRCTELSGYLALVNDPGYTSFNQSIVEDTVFYFDDDPLFEEVPFFEKDFWLESNAPLPSRIDEETTPNPCAMLTRASEVTEIVHMSCEAELYFMCTRPVLISAEKPNMEVFSPYLDQLSLLNYPSWTRFQVFMRSDSPPTENEILFVQTPTTYLNSTSNFSPSDNQNARYDVISSSAGSKPYDVNVTLPSAFLIPQRRRRRSLQYNIRKRQVEGLPGLEDQGNPIDIDQVARTCGYYSFGTYKIFPSNYEETDPVLIRYSERDLYIYIVTVGIRDWLFVTGGEEGSGGDIGLSQQDVILRKLTNDESYVSNLMEYVGGVLSQFRDDTVPVQYYRGLIEDVSFESRIMKLRIFLSPSNSRNMPRDYEQVVAAVLEEYLKSNLNSDAFAPETLRLRSTVSCPTRSFFNDDKMTTVTFPITRAGDNAYSWERCYQGNGALASANCEGGYIKGVSWRDVVYNTGCQDFPQLNESSSTANLKNLSETIITQKNVATILNDTYQLTVPELNLTEADIIYTAEILYNYWQFVSEEQIELDDIFDVLNNVIQAVPDVIATAQQLNNAANRIIRSVDELTNDFELTSMGTRKFVRSFVASAVRYQTGEDDLVIGLELENSMETEITEDALLTVEQSTDVIVDNTDTAIYLSRDIVKGAKTRLSFHIYSKTELFATPQGRFAVNSKVAAARLERNGRPVLYLGDDRVTVVFEVIEVSEYAVCGYWDYFANEDAGGWKTDGCTLTTNGRKIICECDHLTNFAVLIDMEAHEISDTHKAILAIVTKVGLIISIIGLGLTIVTFLIFKHLRNGRGQQVLVNLSVAMLCSAVIFLVGMDRVESKTGCKVVAVLLHYFILVSFAWMLVEGLLQYLRFVKVLGTYIPNFMMKSMIPAWGLPLIPVTIVLAIDHDLYYGGKGYCWLDPKAMLYAFIIPVALVIFANIIVFILVLCNICRRRNKGMRSNQSERKMAFLHFQAAVSIFVILGLTWVFGFMAVDEAQLAFHYIFAILNAFQGFFVFLLFTVREKQIRKAWRKLCCKKSQYKSTGSASGTDSTPRKMSSDTSGSKVTSSGIARSDDFVNFNNPQFHRD